MSESKPEKKKPTRRKKSDVKRRAEQAALKKEMEAGAKAPASVAEPKAAPARMKPAKADKQVKAEKPTKAEKPAKPKASERVKSAKRSTVVLTVVALVIALVVAAFVCVRWLIHDDTIAIQGEWCVEAAGETLVIDDHQMKLTKSVTYEYRLDTFGKNLYFSFSNLQGEANYYFSLDGQQLVITEGDAPNILVQIGLLPNPAIAVDTTDDNVIVLTKISDDTNAKPAAKVENNSTPEADSVGADIVAGNNEGNAASGAEGSSDQGASGKGSSDGSAE